ncbi:MAG: gluconate 2-dehydrogenase subunit 3 family protein [Bacteroidales bacterium]|nr:gluconate 2-dehydrogenase subunit 3 family protein [Bacteroidales bacterium]
MKLTDTSRREFLKTGILGIGSVMMLPSCMKNYTPWQFFTEEEAICMAAICEQIIPTDDHGPGATYAGVIFYIDKQLDEVFTWDRDKYRRGIPAIQRCAVKLHGSKFEALEFSTQTDMLESMESGKLPAEAWNCDINQGNLFSTMVQHTMQGFYGSPRHGGNKNYISYRLMNLDYPYIVGQNRYRHLKAQ